MSDLKPSAAAPLTPEDQAIFQARYERLGSVFMFYMKAAYLDYFTFFAGAVARAAEDKPRIIH